MQGGDGSAAYLREMASKCRLLAGELSDERAAASLRKLAEEYDEAANAAEQRESFTATSGPKGWPRRDEKSEAFARASARLPEHIQGRPHGR